jgi:hypothetical protein
VLKWAKQNGCELARDSSTCYSAAINGHLYIFILNEVLKWAKQNDFASYMWRKISKIKLLTVLILKN